MTVDIEAVVTVAAAVFDAEGETLRWLDALAAAGLTGEDVDPADEMIVQVLGAAMQFLFEECGPDVVLGIVETCGGLPHEDRHETGQKHA